MKKTTLIFSFLICAMALWGAKSENVVSQLNIGMSTNEVRSMCGNEEKTIIDEKTGIRTLQYKFESADGGYVFYNLNFLSLHLVSCSKLIKHGKYFEEIAILPKEATTSGEQYSHDTIQNKVDDLSSGPLRIKTISHKLDIGAMVDDQYTIAYGKVTIDHKSWKDGYVLRTEQRDFLLPNYIYNQYNLGQSCFKAGVVTISIGSVLALVGGVVYGVGVSKTGTKDASPTVTAGAAILSVGSTGLGVSVPLLCFGDHMKRESNIDFSIFNTIR